MVLLHITFLASLQQEVTLMCMICVDYQKQLLSAAEVRRNMGEMVIDPEHREEIEKLLEENDK